MTTNTLFAKVAALGFDDYSEPDEAFIHFATLAQSSIALEHGELCRALIPKETVAQKKSKGERFVSLDLSRTIEDFLAPFGVPETLSGTALSSALVSGGRLTLPTETEVDIVITYRRKPREISLFTPNEEIDIPRHLEHLLPLLTASYLWLDDSPDKAQYYMELYRIEASKVKNSCNSFVGSSYNDVTGWA